MEKINDATGKYVKPFTALEVKRIKTELSAKPNKRDYAIFVIAINQGIRSTDLLKIRIKDIEHLSVGERFTFKEIKTGKSNYIHMNNATHEALHIYLDSIKGYDPDQFLFASRKGTDAITLQQFGRLIKTWCGHAKVKNPSDYGVRSLRKTFGRITFETSDNPRILALLKERFNHVSEQVTIRYLDITTKDMESIFDDI